MLENQASAVSFELFRSGDDMCENSAPDCLFYGHYPTISTRVKCCHHEINEFAVRQPHKFGLFADS